MEQITLARKIKYHRTDGKKECAKCKTPKATEDFHKKKGALDGLDCYCKPCRQVIADELSAKRKASRDEFRDLFI